MDTSLKCKEIISRMINLIFNYTGIYAKDLTEAIVTVMYLKEQSEKKLRAVCSGTIERLTAEDLKGITKIKNHLFFNNTVIRYLELPDSVTELGDNCFSGCTALEEVTFRGTPTSLDRGTFAYCTNLKRINVPWAEGEVGNAPWGADNAVINYNYTE